MQTIEVRCLKHGISVAGEISVTLVISEDENDVGLCCSRGNDRKEKDDYWPKHDACSVVIEPGVFNNPSGEEGGSENIQRPTRAATQSN
jgi:hypothetical protein